jgi:hypothetical protein
MSPVTILARAQYKGPTKALSMDTATIWNNPTGWADCLIELWSWNAGASSMYYFHFSLGNPMELGGSETRVSHVGAHFDMQGPTNVSDGGTLALTGKGGTVDFASTSSSDYSTVATNQWLIDGSPVSNDASFASLVTGEGSHSIQLTVTDEQGATASATATVTVPSCTAGGGTADKVSSTFGASRTIIKKLSQVNRYVGVPCGDETGAPGSGGGSPDESDPHCRWHRDYATFGDGSWSWLGPWTRTCDGYGEALRIPTAMMSATSRSQSAVVGAEKPNRLLRVRLRGVGPLKSGRAIELHTSSSLDIDVEVNVDTSLTNPADLATALLVAEDVETILKAGNVTSIINTPSAALAAKVTGSSRADDYLKALHSASEKQSEGAAVRILDIAIERRSAKP